MADLLSTDYRSLALSLGKLLDEHKGIDTLVMDLSGLNAWTDYFVITTVMSSTHLKGLQKHVKELTLAEDVEILRRQRKAASDDEWNLIDLGNIVVHLMTERSRSFYELERLWSNASILWKAGK